MLSRDISFQRFDEVTILLCRVRVTGYIALEFCVDVNFDKICLILCKSVLSL